MKLKAIFLVLVGASVVWGQTTGPQDSTKIEQDSSKSVRAKKKKARRSMGRRQASTPDTSSTGDARGRDPSTPYNPMDPKGPTNPKNPVPSRTPINAETPAGPKDPPRAPAATPPQP